jgi:predicted TIM-barrel fold metal-dependent hydrolase
MSVIDVHSHLGYDEVFEVNSCREELVAAHQQNGVDTTIVQPGATVGLASARQQHDEIARLAREFPGEFVGMACVSPRLPEADYREEVKRCVRELGFVGIKLHTLAHATAPGSKAGRVVFDTAAALDVPVMIHTGSGLPWAAPALIIPVANDFPTVRIVMAHSGGQLLSTEALIVAQTCPNVWLETTWLPGGAVRNFVRTLGPERVLFGSDMAYNLSIALFTHRAIGLTDSELEWVLGGTASEVYRLDCRSTGGGK